MSFYGGLWYLSFKSCRGQMLFTHLPLEFLKISMGTIVFSFLTVGNGLSLSKFSFIGLLEELSQCSGEGVGRKVCVTSLLPKELRAGVVFYAFKVPVCSN